MKKWIIGALLCCLALPGMTMAAENLSFNKASAEELVNGLDGMIDAELAKSIVEYREKNGLFKAPDDLLKVPGMRPITFNAIEPTLVDGDIVYEAEIATGMHSY